MLLVDGENFDAALGGDGERRVKHVDAVAFGRDVELVVFTEELCLGSMGVEEARSTAG